MKKKEIFHWHHIVPRHMGGSNDPTNLEYISLKDHADRHRMLFESHGLLQDKLAWKMLSGKTDEGEILRIELSYIGRQKFLKTDKCQQWKGKISKSVTKVYKNMSLADKKIINQNKSKAAKASYTSGRRDRVKCFSTISLEERLKHFENNREKMAESRRNSKKWHDAVRSPESYEKKMNSSKKKQAVSVNGVIFRSIREASRNTKITYNTLREILLTHLDNSIFFV